MEEEAEWETGVVRGERRLDMEENSLSMSERTERALRPEVMNLLSPSGRTEQALRPAGENPLSEWESSLKRDENSLSMSAPRADG